MRCVDTTFLIDVLRGEPRVRAIFDELNASGEFYTTSVSAFELLSGAFQLGKAREQSARLLLSRFTILELDLSAAEKAARIYAQCRRDGQEIPADDALIAGITLSNGCTLVTNDLNHYKRVPGLKISGW
jgi:predicted nucleic acid-binding protein